MFFMVFLVLNLVFGIFNLIAGSYLMMALNLGVAALMLWSSNGRIVGR
jgi:hypothetical protein